MQKAEQKFVANVVKETLTALFHKTYGIKADILIQHGPKG